MYPIRDGPHRWMCASLTEARSTFASAFVARHTPHVTGLESPAGGTTDVHSRKRTYIGTFLQIQDHLFSEYNVI